MDVESFIAWENRQMERFELVGGVVRMMAGGSANHDLLQMTTGRVIGNRLAGSSCRVHGTNLKARSPVGAIMYPDCFVRCGPHVGGVTVVDDPIVVVEVLSPSTEQSDLTRKRWAYQAIPSLRGILFVDPDKIQVEHLYRGEDHTWRSEIVGTADAVLTIAALGIELPLAELYADADLGAGEPTALSD